MNTIETSQRKQPGRLERMMQRLFMQSATVAGVETLSDHFKIIEFKGDALSGGTWAPGQKIQIAMGGAFVTRTYTPIYWDEARDRGSILAYAHGKGPGSDWIRSVAPGDVCQIFGPRRSLDESRFIQSSALFGDETAFGLAASLREKARHAVHWVFEVTSIAESQAALQRLGLSAARLLERQPDDSHLSAVEEMLLQSISAGATSLVLVGRAPAIQRLGRVLKAKGMRSAQILAKPYWAPGRAGLD